MMRRPILGALVLSVALTAGRTDARAATYGRNLAGDDLFTGPVPQLQIEISPEAMAKLRQYRQVWRQPRPQRFDVQATVRERERVYTNVAIHLKGSFSFQPIDAKPSLTLNFDKTAAGQQFHGLTKIHLNNSVQDRTYICEQFARELFQSVNVPSPRATPALVSLNGRPLGVCVLVEAANKQFVKRHFNSAEGNLYDGGSGGDITKPLKVDSGKNRNDRSDLTNLVKAAREPDLPKRLARLDQALDLERFISFAAAEALIVHWDGYSIGCNNYRLFHDAERDKMVFMPHGLDQLFGVSSSPALSITPPFKGMIAKALFAVPEARHRYLDQIAKFSTNEFRTSALYARVDRLAARLRMTLADDRESRSEFDQAVSDLKVRIAARAVSVAKQLATPKRPLEILDGKSVPLLTWTFKSGPTQPALGTRSTAGGRQILQVKGRGPDSSGAWRTTLLLERGHYEFTGNARTEGITGDIQGTNGVILRVSGERSTAGISISDDWKTLRYGFDVRGIEDVELICEFRGPQGAGLFDLATLRLFRGQP